MYAENLSVELVIYFIVKRIFSEIFEIQYFTSFYNICSVRLVVICFLSVSLNA